MPTGGIERLCAEVDEERPLRIALVDALRRLVPFGPYVWAVTDPATEVAIAPLADIPVEAMAVLPRLIRLRYLTTVNRWTSLDARAESLHRATSGRLDRSPLHRELLADLRVGDIATVVFRDQHGLWGWADLWRMAVDAPFSDRELDRLASVAPPTADQDVAVSIEPCSLAERLDLFARTNALSRRETELLDLLVAGTDTKALAERLFVSQHTVQDHLKSIFAKTGVHTRRALVGRVAGR